MLARKSEPLMRDIVLASVGRPVTRSAAGQRATLEQNPAPPITAPRREYCSELNRRFYCHRAAVPEVCSARRAAARLRAADVRGWGIVASEKAAAAFPRRFEGICGCGIGCP
jgi:hypothetical protein